jgi:hypothetical protein
MKPNPLSTLNHFTVPVSSTDVPEDGPRDVASRKLDRFGVVGVEGARIDAQHLGDVRPFMAVADVSIGLTFDGPTTVVIGEYLPSQNRFLPD